MDISALKQNESFDKVELKKLLSAHTEKGSLIAILQEAQDVFGYLSVPLMQEVAEFLQIPPAQVFGVATFYTQFRLAPIGKKLILLCQGTACHINGAAKIAEAIQEEMEIAEGETTSDGLFTLNDVACLGCCSLSPVMMINETTYGSLEPDKTRKILRNIAKEEGP